ncbi:class I SAM-dependent methyltransferase [bacterium]|nr:class I SAM-dependent methyltransferase [bacterium]
MSRYPVKWSEFSSHSIILDLLGKGFSKNLLDVGTADGQMASSFMKLGWDVTGIEPTREDFLRAKNRGVSVLNMGLEEAIPLLKIKFDAIVLADVLEHVSDPWTQLTRLQNLCHPDSRIIISIPNIAHIYPRLKLVLGKFEYEDRGIMDRTHLRFFTKESLLQLIDSAGLECQTMRFAPTPFELVYPSISTKRWGQRFFATNSKLSRLLPGLFAYQFVVICRIKNS